MTATLDHAPAPATARASWLVLLVVAVAGFIETLDVTIVNVALPDLQSDLGVGGADLTWAVSAYVLVYGGFLLLGGRLADTLGRRRVFTLGLGVFGASSLAAGLAPTFWSLVGFRAVQGLGAALLAPAALALLTTTYPAGRQRDVALGVWGGLAGLGGTLGVVLGGVVIDALSWRWVFLVNVPVIAVLLVAARRHLPESRAPRADRVDVLGAVLGTGGLLLLVLAAVRAETLSWGSTEVLSLLATSALTVAAFLAVERRRSYALMPLRLFRQRSLRVGTSMLALNGAGFLSMFFLTAVYLQQARGASALEAGLEFLPMGIAAIVGAVTAGQLATRVGTRPVQLVGAVLTVAGLGLLAVGDPQGSYATQLLPGFAVYGLGILAVGVPSQLSAQHDIRHDDAGIGSGVVNASYQVGGAVGLSVVTSLVTSHVAGGLHHGATQLGALTGGYRYGLGLAALCAVVIALLALIAPTVRPTPEELLGGH